MVKSYLYQHAQSLGWDRGKLNFRNPKERDSKQREDPRSPKRKSQPQKEMVETQKSSVSNQPLTTLPHTTNASEKHAVRRAHTSITRIKTVDSNQVIVQTHRHRTLSVRVAHAIPTWDKRHPRRRVTLRQLKPKQVRCLRPKRAHATFATNLAILHLTVPIRQLTSKRPRGNCSRTRISWCYGKSLGMTKTNKPAPLASLKHGVMTTYVLYAIRTSPSTIAATPKTSVSSINKHFDTVKSKLRQSPLLKLIREAHEGTDQESSSTDNVLSFSMNHS
jgi:hypothetical protein